MNYNYNTILIMKENQMKIRLFFKTLLMIVIPYFCAVLLFAGIFLAITLHRHSIWRQSLAALMFGIFMYFIRIVMAYPLRNLRALWHHDPINNSRNFSRLTELGLVVLDIAISYLAIIGLQKILNLNTIELYFSGICFTILFISLLIGNLIPPSLAVVEDRGSND